MDTKNQEKGIVIQPKLALYFFGGIEIIMILFSLIGQYLRLSPNSYSIHSLIQEKLIRDFIAEFNVNSEANLVTYYSVSMAIVASLLLFVIAYFKHAAKDRYRFYWTALAWFLLYISIDDASVIHEKTSKYLKNWTVMGGWFEYKWVIVGLVVVGIFAIAFFRFWLHLDNKYKLLFLASASLFFGGAVGAELVGGRWAYSNGSKNFIYVLLNTFEQGLQYLGLTLLIYSLLHYLSTYVPRFSVSADTAANPSMDTLSNAG